MISPEIRKSQSNPPSSLSSGTMVSKENPRPTLPLIHWNNVQKNQQDHCFSINI